MFLPAAGSCDYDGNAYNRGVYGTYWSSSPFLDYAHGLDFDSGDADMYICYRAGGILSVASRNNKSLRQRDSENKKIAFLTNSSFLTQNINFKKSHHDGKVAIEAKKLYACFASLISFCDAGTTSCAACSNRSCHNIGIIPASWKWMGKYLYLYFHSDIYQKLILMQKEYISPEVEILDAVSEGMLCTSNELLEETEGEW